MRKNLINSARKVAAVLGIAAGLFGAQTAMAETAMNLKFTIENYSSGTGTLTAEVSDDGKTVTVTGTKTGATAPLTLDIDANVTVVWKAELSTEDYIQVSNFVSKSGNGLLEVQSGGKIAHAGAGCTICITEGTLNISGGTVSAKSGYAVRNVSDGAVNISGGTVSATSGNAVHNYSTGPVNISGGTVSATYANNIGVGNAVINGGTVNISGGTVSATLGNAVGNAGTVNISGGTVSNIATSMSGPPLRVVYNASNGAVNISDGTVSCRAANGNTCYAVYNDEGTVNISGGEVSISGGTAISYAIYNGEGTVNISGGEVSSSGTISYAIYNASIGKITVSGTAKVTSANATAANGTIYLAAPTVDNTNMRLEIIGGTVENTAANANARAIYNASTGAVSISGGVVQATTGYAIYKNGTGATTLTSGLVFAYGTVDNNVIYGDYTNSSGNAVVVAWNQASGNTNYNRNTSGDIFKSPAEATAVWANKGGKAGIDYANGANTGFIPLAVTVNKEMPIYTVPTGLTAIVGQTLANVALPSGWAWASALTTPVGAAGVQIHKANFTPSDPANFNTLIGIDVSITVNAANPIFANHGNPAIGNVVIQTTANAILLSNLPPNAKVEVYSLQGKQIYSNTNPGNPQILKIGVQTKGMYIVRAGSQTVKAVVK